MPDEENGYQPQRPVAKAGDDHGLHGLALIMQSVGGLGALFACAGAFWTLLSGSIIGTLFLLICAARGVLHYTAGQTLITASQPPKQALHVYFGVTILQTLVLGYHGLRSNSDTSELAAIFFACLTWPTILFFFSKHPTFRGAFETHPNRPADMAYQSTGSLIALTGILATILTLGVIGVYVQLLQAGSGWFLGNLFPLLLLLVPCVALRRAVVHARSGLLVKRAQANTGRHRDTTLCRSRA